MVDQKFDNARVQELGWRQGAILTEQLKDEAFEYARSDIAREQSAYLVVTSHDCDVVNYALEKEPYIEVVRALVVPNQQLDKQSSSGRNPRHLTIQASFEDGQKVLNFNIHEKWMIPRQLLMKEAPVQCLEDEKRRLVAEWLAKRYIRAAFPTSFDNRWRHQMKRWQKLLKKHSAFIQGIYLRLNTLRELDDLEPYKCYFILAVPHEKRTDKAWPSKRVELEQGITEFWNDIKRVELIEVEILGTDEITLFDIETFQRFDADWISFEDGTETVPPTADMRK